MRAFADRQLRNRQDPLDYQNRRVSIIVNFQNPKDRELLINLNLNGDKTFLGPDAGLSAKPPKELELPKPAKPVQELEPAKPAKPVQALEHVKPPAEPAQELKRAKPPVEQPPPPGQNSDDAAQAVLGENPVGDEISRLLKPMLPKIWDGW